MGFPLLAAALPILGNLFGANKAKRDDAAQQDKQNAFNIQQINAQNAYNAPDQIRARAEAAGFNPLAFIGPGVGQQTSAPTSASGGGNFMGAAIADSAMMLADNIKQSTKSSILEKVKQENSSLQKQVTNLTLRPKVGGVYMGRKTPSLGSALGVKNVSRPQVSAENLSLGGASGLSPSDHVRPLIKTDADSFVADPRRGVNNQDTKSHPGYFLLDNPNLPVPLRIPTFDGDEALHWYDYPDLVLPAAGAAWDFLNSPAFGPKDGYARDGEPLGRGKNRPKIKLSRSRYEGWFDPGADRETGRR